MSNSKDKIHELLDKGYTQDEINEIMKADKSVRVSFRCTGELKKMFELKVKKDIRFNTVTQAYLYLMKKYIEEE